MDRKAYVAMAVMSVLTVIALRVLGDHGWWVMPPVLFAFCLAVTWHRWGLRSLLISAPFALLIGIVLRVL